MHKVRVVSPTGTISTFAGTGDIGVDGAGGPATQARIAYPTRVDVGPQFDVYFDYPHGMRHVNPAGTITSWPSMTSWCSSSSGCPGDGQPVVQRWIPDPDDMGVDSAGNLYVLVTMPVRSGLDFQWIRIVSADGTLDTLRLSDGQYWSRCTRCNEGRAHAMAID